MRQAEREAELGGRDLFERIGSELERGLAQVNEAGLLRLPFVGVSDARDPCYAWLKGELGEWTMAPVEILPSARSVISYFVPYSKQAAASPLSKDAPFALWAAAYELCDRAITQLDERLIRLLESAGHEAVQPPKKVDFVDGEARPRWSHKSAAVISKVGSFGVNRVIMTEKGSSGRLSSIITSASIPPGGCARPPLCEGVNGLVCSRCIEACPAGALSRDAINRSACRAHLAANAESIKARYPDAPAANVCGRCIAACPYAYIE